MLINLLRIHQMKGSIILTVISIENSTTLKYHTFSKTTLVLSVICESFSVNENETFKEEESIEILKIIGFMKKWKWVNVSNINV